MVTPLTGPSGAETTTVQVAFWPCWKVSAVAWTLMHKVPAAESATAATAATASVVPAAEPVDEGVTAGESVGDGVADCAGLAGALVVGLAGDGLGLGTGSAWHVEETGDAGKSVAADAASCRPPYPTSPPMHRHSASARSCVVRI